MRLRGFKICQCGALKDLHVGGSGHCEAALTLPQHKCYEGRAECLKFVPVRGNARVANVKTPAGDSGIERDRRKCLQMVARGKGIRNHKSWLRVDITPELPGYQKIWWKIDEYYEEKIDGRWTPVYEDTKGGMTWNGEARLKVALLMGKFCQDGAGVMRISYYDQRQRRMIVQDMKTAYSIKRNKKGQIYAA